MFLLAMIVAAPLAYRQHVINRIQTRKALLKWLTSVDVGGGFWSEPRKWRLEPMPWYQYPHWDQLMFEIDIPANHINDPQARMILKLFPEARIYLRPRKDDDPPFQESSTRDFAWARQ